MLQCATVCALCCNICIFPNKKANDVCALCCLVWHSPAVCCSVLQCVAVCCSVLQCVAVCCRIQRVVLKTWNSAKETGAGFVFWFNSDKRPGNGFYSQITKNREIFHVYSCICYSHMYMCALNQNLIAFEIFMIMRVRVCVYKSIRTYIVYVLIYERYTYIRCRKYKYHTRTLSPLRIRMSLSVCVCTYMHTHIYDFS